MSGRSENRAVPNKAVGGKSPMVVSLFINFMVLAIPTPLRLLAGLPQQAFKRGLK